MKTWLITGCSSGLGRHLAQAVLKAGFNAVVTARNPATVQDIVAAYPQTALAAALDVADQDAVERTVKRAEERFGSIDVLVNNAGHGYRAAVEEGEDDQVAGLFASNFFGAVSMIKAVLPAMRTRRSGTIVNVTSIAGRLAAPGSGYYSAAKFALEGVSDALRKEVGPLGIGVLIVEPGAFRTDFAGRSLHGSATEIADYAATAGLRRKENDKTSGTEPGDPARAARVLVELIEGGTLPVRLLLGSDAVRIVTAEVKAQLEEIGEWAGVSTRTDFPDAGQGSVPAGYT
ncbi:NAD(P)-dependent dehydrogenase (short-subunit alcohol dehydrogenase family) [Xanthomonas campestris]|uniref:oxidoreductase n=1 Tax=Xanthomonas sp. CFBP 8151 TaxID=3035310 RepID=UPI00141AA98B|nr:oxidoreductase [Xanthomonas sp. CFBP 8151]MEB1611104.1 oxidoreductase [Xanthomonas campestris pv. campestris]NIJ75534.1 NAD(P)-dependent dehydrogenase (short-subunit alcohol dehydrogenase family) [Xanthomonas sp. CFBP 8151]